MGNALKGMLTSLEGVPGGSAIKNLPASARRHGFNPWSGKTPCVELKGSHNSRAPEPRNPAEPTFHSH